MYVRYGNAHGQVWNSPADDELSSDDGFKMRQILWQQLDEDNRVWITGHSKGGAIATTCAARLVMRPTLNDRGNQLHQLSVLTFNAPKALRDPLATEYNLKISHLGVTHRCLYNEADFVRTLPPFAGLRHVGSEESHGEGIPILRSLHTREWVAVGLAGVGVVASGGLILTIGTIVGAGEIITLGGVAVIGGTGILGRAVAGGRRANPA